MDGPGSKTLLGLVMLWGVAALLIINVVYNPQNSGLDLVVKYCVTKVGNSMLMPSQRNTLTSSLDRQNAAR